MRSRIHPLTAVSALSAVGALLIPFVVFGVPVSGSSLPAIGLLSSPFLLMVQGHRRAARSVRKNIVLALANVPLWGAWLFVALAMWYGQLGWFGVAVFAPLLAALAAVFLLLARWIREPRTHEA